MKRYIILAIVLLFTSIAFAYNPVIITQGAPEKTLAETASDSVQTLAASLSEDIIVKNGKNIVACYITCETYAIRYTFGTANPTASFGHILFPGQGIYLVGAPAIKKFKYINDTAGQNAVLTITAEY